MEYQKTKKQSSSNRKGRTIVSMILSFLIAVTLTMAALLGSLRLGFLNEKMIVRSLNVKDYYGESVMIFTSEWKIYPFLLGFRKVHWKEL